LTIECEPVAEVLIAGNYTGLITPVRRYPLAPGRYTITLTARGYEEKRFDVIIKEDEETVIKEELPEKREPRPERGEITIITDPMGAFVFVDGIMHDYPTPTKLELLPGTYKLEIVKRGYEKVEDSITIAAGDMLRKEYILKEKPKEPKWMVVVESEPTGAKVLLDDVPIDKYTPTTLILGPGVWRIGVVKPGYLPAEEVIELA